MCLCYHFRTRIARQRSPDAGAETRAGKVLWLTEAIRDDKLKKPNDPGCRGVYAAAENREAGCKSRAVPPLCRRVCSLKCHCGYTWEDKCRRYAGARRPALRSIAGPAWAPRAAYANGTLAGAIQTAFRTAENVLFPSPPHRRRRAFAFLLRKAEERGDFMSKSKRTLAFLVISLAMVFGVTQRDTCRRITAFSGLRCVCRFSLREFGPSAKRWQTIRKR